MTRGLDGAPAQPLQSVGAIVIQSCGRKMVGPEWSSAPGSTPYLGSLHTLMGVHHGELQVSIDGTWYQVPAGSLIVVPGFRDLLRATTGCDHTWVTFSCSSLAADLQLARQAVPAVLPLDTAWSDGLAVASTAMADLSTLSVGKLALLESLLLRAIGMMQNGPHEPGILRSTDGGLARRAARWLDEHYLNRPSLADTAAALGCSPSHLHAKFSAALGLSPSAYAEKQRLRDAQILLVTTTLTIREIALRCGYDDPFHFNRVVRRAWGKSPRQMRLECLPTV